MANKVQNIFEKRWAHTERDLFMRKALNKYMIEISKETKEKLMQNAMIKSWSLEDLNKLKANRFRPINELVMILQNRYNEDQVREMKAQIMKEMHGPRKKKTCQSKFSDDDFKIMYENRALTKADFLLKYPEFKKKASLATINWYLDAIRAEIRGTQTALPQHFYDLLRVWYNSSNVPQLPVRGSKSIRADVTRAYNKKNASKTKEQEPTSLEKPNLRKEIEDAIKAEEAKDSEKGLSPAINTLAVSLPDIKFPEVDNKCQQESKSSTFDPTEVGFTHAAELKFGLMLDKELKLIGETPAHIEGAELVYRQLGLASNLRKVKILVEAFE